MDLEILVSKLLKWNLKGLVEVLKPVELWDEGQLSHITSHKLYIKRTKRIKYIYLVYKERTVYKNVLNITMGGVRYIRTSVFTVRQFSLCSDSQNTKELIYWVNTPLVIICLINPRTYNFSLSIYLAHLLVLVGI